MQPDIPLKPPSSSPPLIPSSKVPNQASSVRGRSVSSQSSSSSSRAGKAADAVLAQGKSLDSEVEKNALIIRKIEKYLEKSNNSRIVSFIKKSYNLDIIITSIRGDLLDKVVKALKQGDGNQLEKVALKLSQEARRCIYARLSPEEQARIEKIVSEEEELTRLRTTLAEAMKVPLPQDSDSEEEELTRLRTTLAEAVKVPLPQDSDSEENELTRLRTTLAEAVKVPPPQDSDSEEEESIHLRTALPEAIKVPLFQDEERKMDVDKAKLPPSYKALKTPAKVQKAVNQSGSFSDQLSPGPISPESQLRPRADAMDVKESFSQPESDKKIKVDLSSAYMEASYKTILSLFHSAQQMYNLFNQEKSKLLEGIKKKGVLSHYPEPVKEYIRHCCNYGFKDVDTYWNDNCRKYNYLKEEVNTKLKVMRQELQKLIGASKQLYDLEVNLYGQALLYKTVDPDPDAPLPPSRQEYYIAASKQLLTNRIMYISNIEKITSSDEFNIRVIKEFTKNKSLSPQQGKFKVIIQDLGEGDYHNGGRAPVLLKYYSASSSECICSLVYKPRNAEVDMAVFDLFEQINGIPKKKRSSLLSLQTHKRMQIPKELLGKEPHGSIWEYIPGGTLGAGNSPFSCGANQDYLERVENIARHIRLTDLHGANVIMLSEPKGRFALIDLESIGYQSSPVQDFLTGLYGRDGAARPKELPPLSEAELKYIRAFNEEQQQRDSRILLFGTDLIKNTIDAEKGVKQLAAAVEKGLEDHGFQLNLSKQGLRQLIQDSYAKRDYPYFSRKGDKVYYGSSTDNIVLGVKTKHGPAHENS